MVHVKKCPNPEGRGNPTTEFYIDGKPQIYCYGWIDGMTDEPLQICKECLDWVAGEQIEIDFEKARKNNFKSDKLKPKEKNNG